MAGSDSGDMRIWRRPAQRSHGTLQAVAQTSEYSILGLTRAADEAAVRERRFDFTVALFGTATVIALLYSFERYLHARVIGTPVSLVRLVPAELVFTYSWAL